MLDKFPMRKYTTGLKFKAAQKYNISPEKCHLGHVILQGLLTHPEAIHQIDAATDERETNISVANRSMQLATAMNNHGLKPGDVVVIMGQNHLDIVVPLYACHFNGYSVCAIDSGLTTSDYKMLFETIKPKIVFCQKSSEEKLKPAFTTNNLKEELVIFDDENCNLTTFIREHHGTEANFRPAVFDQSKIPAWLMLTSGTTGLPKAAIVPYETCYDAILSWWDRTDQEFESLLAMATLHWASALLSFTSGPLKRFTRIQSSAELTPQSLVYMINKYKPNITAWTPFILGQFMVAAEKGCDLSCFKHIAIGGSAIEKELLNKFRTKYTASLDLVYSMTELCVPIFDYDVKTPADSSGTPLDKYQYKLVDEDGNKITEINKTGELWVKGDDFFKGYMNNPEETALILTDDGWLRTGDIFYRDEQNYYYFLERKRLLIKHFGFLISPLQLEKVIKSHPQVAEACVVGLPDPECQEIPIAAIQRKNGVNIDPEEIFALLRNSPELSERKQIRGGLFFIDSCPITPSGKINRAKITHLAQITPKILQK